MKNCNKRFRINLKMSRNVEKIQISVENFDIWNGKNI